MHTEQLPPPRPHSSPASAVPDEPAPDDRVTDDGPAPIGRRFPTLSAAGWLAAAGATLLLVASIVVVASQWQTITPEIRFAGLVAALCASYFVAEAGRPRYPATATALATLAATITAPVGIAAASSLDQTWPVCVLVGGLAALVAAEVQARRWDVATLRAATVAGTGLAAAGLAALTSTPVAVIVAGAAAAALALGARRRSIVLGVAVGCSPALLALSDAGVGTGTLARIGATGPQLGWSAPLSATLAALVIAVTAHRRRDLTLVALATATLASGALVGLGHQDVGPLAWWSIPALVLIGVEAIAITGRRSVWGDAASAAAPWIALPLALGGVVAPVVAFAGRGLAEFGGGSAGAGWAVPLGLTAAALAVATAGSSRRAGRPLRLAATFAGAAGAAFGAVIASGATAFGWPEVGTLAAATALVGRTQHAAWLHTAAVLAVVVVGAALGVAGIGADESVLALMAITVTLTGVTFLRGDVTPLDTAAIGNSVLLVLAASEASPVANSAAFTVATGQWTLYAIAQRNLTRGLLSGTAFVLSLVSLWWTTGTNEWFVGQVERYGADGADIALGLATAVLLTCGLLLRRFLPASSWLAYSPGLGMAAAWLLDAQFEAQTAWATFAALGIGVVSIGIGGARRLGAPLVIGTVITAATVLISAGPRLADAPTWSWIAAGGIGLLVCAAAIERSSRPLIGGGDELSLLDQFRRDFG